MAAHPAKLSSTQKQVLSLFRVFLRAARLKATEDQYLLRHGKRQLDQLKDLGTKGLSTLKVGPAVPPNNVLG